MGGLMGGSPGQKPTRNPEKPKDQGDAASNAAIAERVRRLTAKGKRSTMLTENYGATAAPTLKKTLGGM